MIAINNLLISNQIVEEQFVCDLNKCKGGCCSDGDAGAPLETKKELERQGRYVYDTEFGWVTPTINSKICVYGIKDANGIIKCGIEKAFNDGKIKWKKPISCHLFPIRIKKSAQGKTEFLNYQPREDLCKAACTLGKKLKVPVYVFLKDALIRKYGEEFYNTLSETATHLKVVSS